MRRRAAMALLALAPLASGCAAAMLAPAVLAGGGMATAGEREARSRAEAAEDAAAALQSSIPLETLISPLPPPVVAPVGADPWQALADYALARKGELGGLEPVASALLVNPPTLGRPDRLPCRAQTPAVLIDLDAGRTAFAAEPGATPAPGLAEALAKLREEGVVVMWISQADANRVTAIGDLLRRSGLDPTGRDPLLLVRGASQRKQVMREDAGTSVCLLAIAGDRRGDFDELFDYLRVPELAGPLDAMLGDGWFLTPLPLSPAPSAGP